MLALSLAAKRFLIILAFSLIGILLMYAVFRTWQACGLDSAALQALFTATGAALWKGIKELRRSPAFKEEVFRMNKFARQIFRKLSELRLVWSGTFDGVPVHVTSFTANVGTVTELDVAYLLNGEKQTIFAEYVLAGSSEDAIVWNGANVDADDVDFMVTPGLPRSKVRFNFQFTGADGVDHELILTSKVNVLALIT